MGARKRKMEADYINTATTGSDPTWSLCGTGFTALTETPSAQTSSKRYINMASASQSITGYEWSAPFEAEQIKEEAAINYILNVARKQLTGSDAEADLIQVDLDDAVSGAESANTFHARKRRVAIAVSEMPDNDGTLGVTGDFLGVGDPIEGTFNTTTKTFTVA